MAHSLSFGSGLEAYKVIADNEQERAMQTAFDLVIRGGEVFNGSGRASAQVDVAVVRKR